MVQQLYICRSMYYNTSGFLYEYHKKFTNQSTHKFTMHQMVSEQLAEQQYQSQSRLYVQKRLVISE